MKHREHKAYSTKACIKALTGNWLVIKALGRYGPLEATVRGFSQHI